MHMQESLDNINYKKRKKTSKGKKHLKKMKVDVGMTKNSVQKNQETRKEIAKRKWLIYYHPYIKPINGSKTIYHNRERLSSFNNE